MPVILATQETEIRRITVQSQHWQIVRETLSQKTLHKNRACGVDQGEGPKIKSQYHKKKKNKKKTTNPAKNPKSFYKGSAKSQAPVARAWNPSYLGPSGLWSRLGKCKTPSPK
jgi:hypothetical protein